MKRVDGKALEDKIKISHCLDDEFQGPTHSLLQGWLKGEGTNIFAILVYGLIVAASTLAIPLAVQTFVNTLAFGVLLQPVILLACLVLTILLFAGVIRALQEYIAEVLQRRYFVRVAVQIADRIPFLHHNEIRNQLGQDYVNRFLEISRVKKHLADLLLIGATGVIQILLGLLVLAFYHPLFLAFSLVLLTCIVVGIWITGRNAVQTALHESNAKYSVLSWLENLWSLPTSMRSEIGNAFAMEKADALIGHYIQQRRRFFHIVFRQHIGILALQAIASAVLLGLGGMLVVRHQLTLGQLVAGEIIVTLVLEQVLKVSKQLRNYYEVLASFVKLQSITSLPRENLSGDTQCSITRPAEIVFRNVMLDNRRTPLALNFNIPSGSKIAIYGRNGVGKSILANYLYALEKPSSGMILLDGHPLSDIHPLTLRKHVMLIRGVEVFEGTISNNLCFGMPIQLQDVWQALERLGLREVIERLPDRLETVLPGNYGPLSRGQAACLVLARALLFRPQVLIIDETLDALDEDIQERVIKILLDPAAPWTLIVMSHDKSVHEAFPERWRFTEEGMRPCQR
jgi:putative ABC transport system ATP-binding protein